MYLYSMELGSPQLYADANRAARDMELTYLSELGPYLKALAQITRRSENFKNQVDKVTSGKELGGIVRNISGSFMLFRGATMKNEWIYPYIQHI